MRLISRDFANRFADQWIEAWNAHDLAAVLSHYSDDMEMSSPYIIQLTDESSGTLKGKSRVADYWSAALEIMPTLQFELLQVLIGVDSITINYRSVNGIAAEVSFFNDQGLIHKACAHYA